MDSARLQVDEALRSGVPNSREQVSHLVGKTLEERASHGILPRDAVKSQTVALTAIVCGMLKRLRGVVAADDASGGSDKWKVYETAEDSRVLYRDFPGATPSVCVEGVFDGAKKSGAASPWVADNENTELSQSTVHPFKPAQEHAQSHEPDLRFPFNSVEIRMEEYALEDDVTVMLMTAPITSPLRPGKVGRETVGGLLLKRTSPTQGAFRAVSNVSLNAREELWPRVATAARHLAGLCEAVFEKLSARDFKDPAETAIRVTLKKGDSELGTVIITAFEKIKNDLGEQLRQPGAIDREALSTWLKATKLDVAGEPRVEFRPVDGCNSEELSRALLELEACGPNLENVTTPGGVHLEVSIGARFPTASDVSDVATSSSPIVGGDDSESDAEFLDSAEELKQEEDSENEASGRERSIHTPGGSGRGSKSAKSGTRRQNARSSHSGAAKNDPTVEADGNGAGVAPVTARGGAGSKKTIGRKRPAEALASGLVDDAFANVASAVRELGSEATTSQKTGAEVSALPVLGTERKEKDREAVLGLGPGIATISSSRGAGPKPAQAPRKDGGGNEFQGGPATGAFNGGGANVTNSPVERAGDGAMAPSDDDLDDRPSLVDSEDEDEDEMPPPRHDYLTETDVDVLRARIVELDARAADLEAKSRKTTTWAHEKVMQAAQKGRDDSTEIKNLRAKVAAAEQRLREGDERDRGLAKRVKDSEDMVKRTQDYVKGLEKKQFLLEKHLKEVRSELEASLLKESETASRETKALKAEKALQKKAAAWEKQRKTMQDEINSERARANSLVAAAARAEESARQATVRARQEERAAREAAEHAAAEKRAREVAERDFKRKDAAAKRVSDGAAEKFRAEISRLEREVARLKLAEDETTLGARFGVNVRQAQALGFDGPPPVYDVLTSPPGPLTSPPARNEMSALREHNHRLRKELAGLQSAHVRRERECVMCMSEEQSVVFLPCAHQVLCGDCNQEHLEKGHTDCPSCRTRIVQRIKVYGK